MTEYLCLHCDGPAKHCCADCFIAHYCSAECQQEDWDAHHAEEHEIIEEHVTEDGEIFLGNLLEPTELIERRKRARRRKGRKPRRRRRKRRKKKWVQRAIRHPGSFTRKAKRRGMTPAAFQRAVLSNPNRYDATTVRQANLRKTLVRM